VKVAWVKSAVQRRVGRHFSQRHATRHWWHSEALRSYIDREICAEQDSGVVGALQVRLAGDRVARGVSVGCGEGAKERRLIHAGLVDKFDLFELSPMRAEKAARAAESEGVEAQVEVFLEDAFARPVAPVYELVYWDHALHHMFDVQQALDWSVRVLVPGGLLVVNDYVGPVRLQWTRREVQLAREFFELHLRQRAIGARPPRQGNWVTRLRQIWRDPSEAPQSDRIMVGFERATGTSLRPLGGAMIHLLGGALASAVEDQGDPLYAELIRFDRYARSRGVNHFSFGVWKKPL